MALRSEGSSITCSRTASICCLRSLLDHSCHSGLEIAKQENLCSININELGGGIKKECCDCCLLAKDLLSRDEECTAPKGFSAACLTSFNRCCKNEEGVKPPVQNINLPSITKTTSLTIHDDRCSQAKCEHFCTDRGGETIECSCKPGYDLGPDGFSCVDVDECLALMDDCLESQRCLNTPGSYKCMRTLSCGTGYALDSKTELCLDVDECNLGSHDCGPLYQCRNIQGSYRCDPKKCLSNEIMNPTTGECTSIDCPVGYYPKNGKCEDVDECQLPSRCSQYDECINSPGSYRCQEKGNLCSLGYKIDKETGFCIDINECAENLHNCGSLQCINLPGTYRCRCSAGFEFNETSTRCEDVDECKKFSGHMCSLHAICENTIGSFLCHCKPGFLLSADGRNCDDINECTNGVAKCEQKCINTPGNYQCLCHRGYQLSADESTCEDIDECASWLKSGTEICMGECENTPGSYKCRCPIGYDVMSDGITCKDIDECLSLGCPNVDEVCINTLGSFKCQKITCPPNYIFDQLHKNRCMRKASFCDHLSRAQCNEYPVHISWQHIAIPKHVNISAQRTSVTLFSMKGPTNPNTVMQFELRLVQATPEGTNVISAVRSNFLLQKGDNPNSAGAQSPK
uniref:Fibulin-1 n=1 Tax=Acrobeloides nanus TaxID=290746 RepID=A0A914C537_9BILA